MAATFYVEPVLTFDLDVFAVRPLTSGALLTQAPLYEEALDQARETLYESTPTRVFRAEHLAAIALHTGRAKDRERLRVLLEYPALDRAHLAEIVERHKLKERWEQWTSR